MWMTSHCSLRRETDAVVSSSKRCHLKVQTYWHKHSSGVISDWHISHLLPTAFLLRIILCPGVVVFVCGVAGACVIRCFVVFIVGWLLFVKCSIWERLNCSSLYRMISASFVFESNQPIGWQDCMRSKVLFFIRMWCWRITFSHPWSLLPAVAKQKFAGVLVPGWNFLQRWSFQVYP